jgi:lysophospholipase L1-like esterase
MEEKRFARQTSGGHQMTDNTVLFLGDSLTAGGDWGAWFPDVNTLNFGIGGSTTDDIVARLDSVVAADPDEIILLIGTNDLGTRQTVEHLVRNVQSILVELRRQLPGSRMLVQSIMPRGREFADRIQEANIHLRQFSATVHAQYLDLWPVLALDDGELNPTFSDDRLHLNAAGYEAWLTELRPGLERLREEPPMSRPIQIIRVDEYARPEF